MPTYIPRALNTGICIQQGDLFYSASLHRHFTGYFVMHTWARTCGQTEKKWNQFLHFCGLYQKWASQWSKRSVLKGERKLRRRGNLWLVDQYAGLWTQYPVWILGRGSVKDRFSVLQGQHVWGLVRACFAFVCVARTKIVAYSKDPAYTFREIS